MQLRPERADKPLDVGNGVVAGTVGRDGALLTLATTHPTHGRIVLTTAAPFDEAWRRDPAAVRRWRAGLAGERGGLGDRLPGAIGAELVEASLPRLVGGTDTLTVAAPEGWRGVIQVRTGGAASGALLDGARLERAAYTQLTEGGPLPRFIARPRAGAIGEVRWLADDGLEVAVAAARSRSATAWAFGATPEAAAAEARSLADAAGSLLASEVARRSGLAADHPDVVRRAVAYALDCAAVDVGGEVTAILADHEILPLVWTRDAYYVAAMLLAIAPEEPRAGLAVGGFLRWCFARAERPAGWWPRSSLASGQAKDHAFQLDQQLYPLLLLAEHAAATGDDGLRRRYAGDAAGVLDRLLARSEQGLIATAETPADDPLAEPYHFSSHVLLWRTLGTFGRRSEAARLRRRVGEAFVRDGRFAYAVGPSGHRHYHDANDLPTALAAGWGFCDPDDPVWRATLAFGWSEANAGYIAGPLAGLGSLHTRHPWPLGDLQRVLAGRATGDAALEGAAWERLAMVETWDGLLPEAYDEATGSVASRHWFAWPTAVRAHLLATTPPRRLTRGASSTSRSRAAASSERAPRS